MTSKDCKTLKRKINHEFRRLKIVLKRHIKSLFQSRLESCHRILQRRQANQDPRPYM